MEVKKRFLDSRVSTLKNQSAWIEKPEEFIVAHETDPLVLTPFLQTYMNLLRDQKAVEELQELIDNCDGNGKLFLEQCAVHKVEKIKKMTN